MGNPITENMKIGAVGEILVQLRLLEIDVQAAAPIKDAGNDLIAVRGEVFRGIQVKTTAHNRTCDRSLPDHYHILALVHLEADDTQLLLDKSSIYLVPRSVIEAHGRVPRDLSSFRISREHVDTLFPIHATGHKQ